MKPLITYSPFLYIYSQTIGWFVVNRRRGQTCSQSVDSASTLFRIPVKVRQYPGTTRRPVRNGRSVNWPTKQIKGSDFATGSCI